jgi:lipoprotein-anchoring transpeptidase ErfK/SrfK
MRQFIRRCTGAMLLPLVGGMLAVAGQGVAVAATPAGAVGCPSGPARVACVDLTHQTLWVESRGKTTWGPVKIKSGAKGTPTRTGLWHVYRRNRYFVSSLTGASMPYSQFFDGGIALHAMTTPMRSLGCVEMSIPDAASLWRVTHVGDPVFVFGHKH